MRDIADASRQGQAGFHTWGSKWLAVRRSGPKRSKSSSTSFQASVGAPDLPPKPPKSLTRLEHLAVCERMLADGERLPEGDPKREYLLHLVCETLGEGRVQRNAPCPRWRHGARDYQGVHDASKLPPDDTD